MKKLLLLQLTLMFFLGELNAQIYKKGDFVVDSYIGPNITSGAVRFLVKKYAEIKDDNSEISSFGPIGLRGEYLVSKRIGVGLNFNYANTKMRGVIHETEDFKGNPIDQYYDFKAVFPRLRLYPTVSIHLGNSIKLDPYFLLGVGYNNTFLKINTDDPYYKFGSIKIMFSHFSMRGEFGLRYFFFKNLGIHAQLGYAGGPIVATGLSGRF